MNPLIEQEVKEFDEKCARTSFTDSNPKTYQMLRTFLIASLMSVATASREEGYAAAIVEVGQKLNSYNIRAPQQSYVGTLTPEQFMQVLIPLPTPSK